MNPVAPWLEMWLLCFTLFGAAKLGVRFLVLVVGPCQTHRWLALSCHARTATCVWFDATLRGRREGKP
jgi:hypothetical protein